MSAIALFSNAFLSLPLSKRIKKKKKSYFFGTTGQRRERVVTGKGKAEGTG